MSEPDVDPSGSGIVVLDIGEDIGAAVVYVDQALAARELEIRRMGEPWAGRHTGIHRRPADGGVEWVAVFPSLPAGDYEVRVIAAEAPAVTATLTVDGGAVASLTYPI